MFPHIDKKESIERKKWFKRIFSENKNVKTLDKYANLSLTSKPFKDPNFVSARFDVKLRK